MFCSQLIPNLQRLFVLILISITFSMTFADQSVAQSQHEPTEQPNTVLHFSLQDSTALEDIKALIKDGQYTEAESNARELRSLCY